MSTRDDPLAKRATEGPLRLHYAEGMMLDAEDFYDEQHYHRSRLARSLKYLFGTGTVAGLTVTGQPVDSEVPAGETREIKVAPGMALDPIGRIIELTRAACIRVTEWYNSQNASDLRSAFLPAAQNPEGIDGVVADVFIRFVVCERGKTPVFSSGPYDAIDAAEASRLGDGYALSLALRTEAAALRNGDITALPTPPDQFEEGAALLSTPETIKDHVLSGWREGTDSWTDDRPDALPEHLSGQNQDTTAVLLARIVIPADEAPSSESIPARRLAEAVLVNNHIRRFVIAPGVLSFLQSPSL